MHIKIASKLDKKIKHAILFTLTSELLDLKPLL
jgi:hypothetical protein